MFNLYQLGMINACTTTTDTDNPIDWVRVEAYVQYLRSDHASRAKDKSVHNLYSVYCLLLAESGHFQLPTTRTTVGDS